MSYLNTSTDALGDPEGLVQFESPGTAFEPVL